MAQMETTDLDKMFKLMKPYALFDKNGCQMGTVQLTKVSGNAFEGDVS